MMTMKSGRPQVRHARWPMLFASVWALTSVAGCAALKGAVNGQSRSRAEIASPELTGLPPQLSQGAAALALGAEGAASSVLQARNRAEQDAATLREYLAAEAYFAATVTVAPIVRPDARVNLVIAPGSRFRVAEMRLDLRGGVSPDLERDLQRTLSAVARGDAARSAPIEQAGQRVITQLRDSGYPFAALLETDALASRRDATLDVTFIIEPGPLVRLGRLDVPPKHTQPDLFATLKTWSDGDIYKPETIDRLRTRLRATGIFNGIGVDIEPSPGPDGTHAVKLALSEAQRKSIGVGVTASTTDGVGADLYWERRNLTGAGDKVRISAEAATLGSELAALYERPNIGRFGRTLTTEAGIRGQETPAFDLQGIKFAAALAQPFNPRFEIAAGVVLDATQTRDLRARFIGEDRDLVTLSFPVTATYSTVTQPLDPQRGRRLAATVESGFSFESNTPGYTRVLLSAATFHKITDEIVLAARATYGAFSGSNDVPVDRLFFAGGGGSVRGYEYQSLSARDEAGNLIGGRTLFDSSAELRWRQSQRFGYAVFVDAGAAQEGEGSDTGDIRFAAGAGIRYYPGFGPIRLDVAAPLDRRTNESPVQVYVSIGQAF